MKMEAQGPAGSTRGLGSHTERRALCISQAGSIREFLQRLPIDQVKQEPDEGLLQHWETQWQEFLKTLESSQSDWGLPQLPEDPPPWENTKGFLASFEQVAEACRWPRAEWVTRLLPALSGEAERAFSQLEGRDREDYGKVKAAILRGDAASREKQRQHFRHFCYQTAVGPRGTYSRLQELCYGWLKVDRQSKEQILELLLLEQFLAILPPEIQSWVREHSPETCAQAVNLAEEFLQAQQRQEKQVTMEVVAAAVAVSSSGTIPPLPDMEQRPLCTETKQEKDAREADVLGQRWLTVDVGDKYPPEDLERVGPCETVAGCTEESTPQESWHKVEFQQGTPAEEKVDGSVPYAGGGVYVDLGEIAVQPRLHTDKMSGKRKSYSVEYKKGIVEDSQGKNLTAFCKEKKLHRRVVQKWRAEYENLGQQVGEGNAKKRKCGAGRPALFPELEDLVCEWIADLRAEALVVRRADIQEFALAMAPQLGISPEDFKASQHWLAGFLQRHELSLRRSTTLFKLEDAEVIKRALAFKSLVDGIDFSKYQLCNMIAMDEIAVFMGQGSQTAVDHRGASSIYVPSTGYESARITCILAIHLDGKKAPPLIIIKGKKERIERVSGIYVLETEKAWCTRAVIRQWVDVVLPLVLRGGQRGLLVWDSASSHCAKDMKNFLAERRIDQILIPAGMTAYLQTLDIAIKKPFKDHLCMEINDYIENSMERNQRGNRVKPSLQEVVTWVKNSWEKITDSCVANALRAGYLDKKCSFKESAIAGHERLGPMVLQAMEESEDILAGIRCLDSYDDDVPEDDMTVSE